MLDTNFLDFQVAVANDAINRLWSNANKLDKRKGKSGKRVHNMRVAFRRWYSVWNVLSREGFETKKFKHKVGGKLKKAYKLLGGVRDWDVNLNTGKEYGVPERVLAKWQHQRNRIEDETFAGLRNLDLGKTVKNLSKYIKKRSRKLRRKYGQDGRYNARPRDAIEGYLAKTEARTRDLASNASSLEDLHALRLSIKAWRYILVEFYGHTSDVLVEAQQLLGQINDLERVRVLLSEEDPPLVSGTIDTIVGKQNQLINNLEEVKLNLPYGLRPAESSDVD